MLFGQKEYGYFYSSFCFSIFFRYFIMSVHYFYNVNKNYQNVNLISLPWIKQLSGKPLRKSEKYWKEYTIVIKQSIFLFNLDSLITNIFFLISCHHQAHGPMNQKQLSLLSNTDLDSDQHPATLLCGLGTLTSLSLSFFMGINYAQFYSLL